MEAFQASHDLTHPGFKDTFVIMHARVVWPFMQRDIRNWCRSCTICQASKITIPPTIALSAISRFDTVHLDIVGPLPLSKGHTYILTMIDRKTRWPEAIPMRDAKAVTVANIFVNSWVSRFGAPQRVITDQDRQFDTDFFNTIAELLGSQKQYCKAYHPQSNGLVERFHRTLKNALRSISMNPDWIEYLHFAVLGWRNIPISRPGASPAQMVFGSNKALNCDLFQIVDPTDDIQPKVIRDHFKSLDTVLRSKTTLPVSVHCRFLDSKFVWLIRDFPTILQSRCDGPYRVIQFHVENNTATIDDDGKKSIVNLNKLKPAIYIEDDGPMIPIQSFVKKLTWSSVIETELLLAT